VLTGNISILRQALSLWIANTFLSALQFDIWSYRGI